jgi:hypothetical protein
VSTIDKMQINKIKNNWNNKEYIDIVYNKIIIKFNLLNIINLKINICQVFGSKL